MNPRRLIGACALLVGCGAPPRTEPALSNSDDPRLAWSPEDVDDLISVDALLWATAVDKTMPLRLNDCLV